jgi:ATP-binding cassette, subfamily B, bacterial PglK
MFILIKQLFSLLTPSQRKRFYSLQILIIIMAFAEIASVASIGPFMGLIGDVTILDRENTLSQIYIWSGISSPNDFVFWFGISVMGVLTVAALFSMFTIWRISIFSVKIGTEIGDRLYEHYMKQGWLFHAAGNSAQLTKQISTEAMRVTAYIINPLMQMNARIILATLMSIAIFLFDPVIAISGLIFFIVAYVLLYRAVRERLAGNGKIISDISTIRYKLMSEGLGGVKDILLFGRQKYFVDRFQDSGRKYAKAQGTNSALAQAPRYFMELIAYGSIIMLVLYLIKTYEGNLGAILPILAIYALAGFKLLPAFQKIYISLAQIKGGIPAFEAIKYDLMASQAQKDLGNGLVRTSNLELEVEARVVQSLSVKSNIELKDVNFTYPGKKESTLNNLSLTIPVNKVIGLVGPSGSGKSTVIDLILGLIRPQEGRLLIDGQPIEDDLLRSWQDTLGFVPQTIYLSDASISENVAFGLPIDSIDMERVKNVIKLSHLNELVQQMPEGLDTIVGERGVQLSGGQRQRIGIARALYNDADVLVLDEATSSLDGITEKLIMNAIHDFSGSKTIIMIAHRLKTVQKCDIIYLMEQGQIKDQGTFDELSVRNKTFKQMIMHA